MKFKIFKASYDSWKILETWNQFFLNIQGKPGNKLNLEKAGSEIDSVKYCLQDSLLMLGELDGRFSDDVTGIKVNKFTLIRLILEAEEAIPKRINLCECHSLVDRTNRLVEEHYFKSKISKAQGNS